MIHKPNLLLVSGSSRNVGKTTFICAVIEQISKKQDIIAVKITPHFHNSREHKKTILENQQVFIAEELDQTSIKDSSLMLRNGASKVYYIEVRNEYYAPVIEFVQNLPDNIPVICESASLRKFINPGLFALIDNEEVVEKKPVFIQLKYFADIIVNTSKIKSLKDTITFSPENGWECEK